LPLKPLQELPKTAVNWTTVAADTVGAEEQSKIGPSEVSTLNCLTARVSSYRFIFPRYPLRMPMRSRRRTEPRVGYLASGDELHLQRRAMFLVKLSNGDLRAFHKINL